MPDVIRQEPSVPAAPGLRLTAEIALSSIVGGTLLGLVIGVVRYLRVPVLAQIFVALVEFIRGTPLLVVLFICYLRLAGAASATAPAPTAPRSLGFILFIAAYLAEDIRSGLRSVRPSLVQAALATGLTRAQALRLVVMPHALRSVIPTLFNQYVRLFKFTSVASVIGVHEFTGSACWSMRANSRRHRSSRRRGHLPRLCFAISMVGRLLYARLACRSGSRSGGRDDRRAADQARPGLQELRIDDGAARVHVLAIARGEIVVVCGPSGSGKSTLIKCINGLEPYQSGSDVDGDEVGARHHRSAATARPDRHGVPDTSSSIRT